MIGDRKVVTKLLDDSKLKQDYCHCWRGKRVRRKAWARDPPMRELEPECSYAECAMHKCVCASVLGIWFLSPASVRRSAESLPKCENS
jgi:hypothetical protein